jgi:hypothetical protein
MGRESKEVVKVFNKGKKSEKKVKVVLFPWERLNAVEATKKAFGLSGTSSSAGKTAKPSKASAKAAVKVAAKPAKAGNGKAGEKKAKQLLLLA